MKKKIPTGGLWAVRSEARRRFSAAARAFRKSGDARWLRSDVAAVKAYLRAQRRRTDYSNQILTLGSLACDFDVRAGVMLEEKEKKR
jgi:hypothetical protein